MALSGGLRRSRIQSVLSFILGCVLIVIVVFLAFRANALTEQQFEILRILLALAGACFTWVIPGSLDVTITAGKPKVRAFGGLAVLTLLYIFSPLLRTQSAARTVIQHTEGAGSPAQNGDRNTVIIGGPLR